MQSLQERTIKMKKIIILILMLGVFGCASKRAYFYQPVETKEPKVFYKDFRETVRISPVVLPQIVARPQITTLGEEDVELIIDEYNRWGTGLDKLIVQVINDNLSNIFENAMIVNQSPNKKGYKYDVTIEIKNLNGRLDEYAKLDASYFIKDKNGKVVVSKDFYKASAFEGKYVEYVKTISAMLGELSDAIANDLVNIK